MAVCGIDSARQPVNLFIEPFYDVSSNNPGPEWGIKLNLTLLFPQG